MNRNENVFGQSRWRIISLLRKRPQGVRDLAEALGITDNAVRPHLVTLERDGLVRQTGVKQSGGQPAHIFELTVEAEQLFPKAYGTILSHLLNEIRETTSNDVFMELLASTGRKLSRRWPLASGATLNKLEAGVLVINELGGLAEITKEGKQYFIQGYSCPLALATKDHPEVCFLAQVLLEELTGLSFDRCCTYGVKPKCRFQVLTEIAKD